MVLYGLCITSGVYAGDISDLINRAAITDVLTQYSYRWDSKDSAGFAELFTEDGILEREVNGETINTATIKGREAIYNYAKTSHEGRLADRQSRHHFSGIVFLDLNETTAVTENMALITHQTKKHDAAYIRSSGYYLNSWQKTMNGWRISKRILKVDSPPN
jgi:uncharacterized protein (TIGR02246 family)